MSNQIDRDEERSINEILILLQKQYAEAARPYFNRLMEIYSTRLPLPITVTADWQAGYLVDFTGAVEGREREK